MNTKNNISSRRSIRVAVGFVLVALVAGVYFLFSPFPAGKSLETQANVQQAPRLVAEMASGRNFISNAQSSETVRSGSVVIGKASAPGGPQWLNIGGGYALENSAYASRTAPAPSFVVIGKASATGGPKWLNIGGGYLLENSSYKAGP